MREEFTGYLVRVKDWHYHYSFRATDPKSRWDPGPYHELSHVALKGDIVLPEKTTFTRATVTFSGRSGLMAQSDTEKDRSIGSVTASADELMAYVFVPMERIAELAIVAQSGRVQIVHFTATRLRYRIGLVVSVSIDTRFDDAEW